MSKNNFFPILLIILLSVSSAFGQVKKKAPTKKKQPNKTSEIQVFDDGDGLDIFKANSTINLSNTIKINPLALVVGDIPVYYERVFTPHLSGEIGVGLTSMSVAIANGFKESGANGISYGQQIVLDKTNIGPYGSAALRYYPSKHDSDIPEGFYVSFGLRYRKYIFNSHLDNENFPFDPTRKSKTTHLDVARLTLGKAFLFESFIAEYFVGVGLRKTYINTYEYDPAANFEIVPYKYSYFAPTFIAGIRIGFGF